MSDDNEDSEDKDAFLEEVTKDDVALRPGAGSDPQGLINNCVPSDIREKYEVYSYRSAALILSQTHREEFEELLSALRQFKITTRMIRMPGGNESEIPKLISQVLRPSGWSEMVIQGDLHVTKSWKEFSKFSPKGSVVGPKRTETTRRAKYIDGHKIDYVKNRTAFDLDGILRTKRLIETFMRSMPLRKPGSSTWASLLLEEPPSHPSSQNSVRSSARTAPKAQSQQYQSTAPARPGWANSYSG